MASFTLRPLDRTEFDSLLGELASQFPAAHVEAAHNDNFASYRVDVSCDAPWEGDLTAWLQTKHGDCPRT
ncbi:hypothetical protein [Caulobacter sp. DWR2-3-1b2]|uniref:hypothetical protein n=1 Tax=Caulobacter sp. DWR2-3-1b2 TaxID=2804642 RepID=UPI003CE9A453